MSDTKHTPGPWRADFGDDTRSSEIWSHGGVVIADVHSHVLGTANHADARLIAEAPELLALAIRTEQWTVAVEQAQIARGERYELSQFVADLRTAIAKATGDAQ